MNRKTKTALASAGILVVSAALVVGATWAFFTDNVTVNNHIEVGDLSIGLSRVSYLSKELQSDGTLAETDEDTTVVDLLKDPKELFRVENAVPGCWYQAKIKISNLGSVSVDYGARFLVGELTDPEDIAFSKQMQLTVTTSADASTSFTLDKAADVDIGNLLAGSEDTFTVKAEFLASEDNNAAQKGSLDFDLQVYAAQAID